MTIEGFAIIEFEGTIIPGVAIIDTGDISSTADTKTNLVIRIWNDITGIINNIRMNQRNIAGTDGGTINTQAQCSRFAGGVNFLNKLFAVSVADGLYRARLVGNIPA